MNVVHPFDPHVYICKSTHWCKRCFLHVKAATKLRISAIHIHKLILLFFNPEQFSKLATLSNKVHFWLYYTRLSFPQTWPVQVFVASFYTETELDNDLHKLVYHIIMHVTSMCVCDVELKVP